MQQRDSKGRFVKAEPQYKTTSLDEVLAEFGYTREELAQAAPLLSERAHDVAPYLYVLLTLASMWLLAAIIWNQR